MSDDQLSARRRSRRPWRASAAARPGRHLELVSDSRSTELAELVVLSPRANRDPDTAPATPARAADGAGVPQAALNRLRPR